MLVFVCLYQYINLQARAVTSIDSSSKTKIFILLLQKVIFFPLVKKSNSTEFYVLYNFFFTNYKSKILLFFLFTTNI